MVCRTIWFLKNITYYLNGYFWYVVSKFVRDEWDLIQGRKPTRNLNLSTQLAPPLWKFGQCHYQFVPVFFPLASSFFLPLDYHRNLFLTLHCLWLYMPFPDVTLVIQLNLDYEFHFFPNPISWPRFSLVFFLYVCVFGFN